MAIAIDTAAGGWTIDFVTIGTNATITGNKPANAVAGDVLVAIVGNYTSASPFTVLTAPTGWTTIHATDAGNGSFRMCGWAGYLVVDGSTASTWDWTLNAEALDDCVAIFRITGVDTSNVLDATAAESWNNTDPPTNPAVTTVTADAVALYLMTTRDGNALAAEDSNYPTGTTGVILRRSRANSSGVIAGLAYETKASAGDTGTKAWTGAMTAARPWFAVTAALRPAAGGGGTAVPVFLHHLRTQGIS